MAEKPGKPIHAGLVFSFRGVKPSEAWKQAFAKAQEKHPLLHVGIAEGSGAKPAFVRGGGAIPWTVDRRSEPEHWREVVEQRLDEPFEVERGPLLRAVLLEDEGGCDLVLTAHHAIADGMALLKLMRDLLSSLGDGASKPVPGPVPPAMEDLPGWVGVEGAQGPAQVFPREYGYAGTTGTPLRVDALQFTENETERLMGAAKREGVTVGAALLAGLFRGLRACSPELRDLPLRAFVPANPRGALRAGEDVSVVISTAVKVAELEPGRSLWERRESWAGRSRRCSASRQSRPCSIKRPAWWSAVWMDARCPSWVPK